MIGEQDRELLRRWVDTWQAAGPLLEAIRRREIESVDTCAAVHQIFGACDRWPALPTRLTSGLVEQQAWFSKLRLRDSADDAAI